MRGELTLAAEPDAARPCPRVLALHGSAPIAVRASWAEPCLSLEVEDAGRRLPVVPATSPQAMTGRGLGLVSAVTSSWGVRALPDAPGKVVWAEIGGTSSGEEPEMDLDALLAAWPDDEPGEAAFTVRLGRVPTDLLLDAKQHIEGVVRELTLERAGASDGSLPSSLRALIDTVTNDFATARAAIKRQAIEAAARGHQETDFVLTLPASAAEAGERYLAALTEADRLSRSARLLTLEWRGRRCEVA